MKIQEGHLPPVGVTLEGLKILLHFICILSPLEMNVTHKMLEETFTTGSSCDKKCLS